MGYKTEESGFLGDEKYQSMHKPILHHDEMFNIAMHDVMPKSCPVGYKPIL